MATGTGIAAVVFAVFLDAIASGNDAQARLAGTFHLGYGSHGFLVILLLLGQISEQLFMYSYYIMPADRPKFFKILLRKRKKK